MIGIRPRPAGVRRVFGEEDGLREDDAGAAVARDDGTRKAPRRALHRVDAQPRELRDIGRVLDLHVEDDIRGNKTSEIPIGVRDDRIRVCGREPGIRVGRQRRDEGTRRGPRVDLPADSREAVAVEEALGERDGETLTRHAQHRKIVADGSCQKPHRENIWTLDCRL